MESLGWLLKAKKTTLSGMQDVLMKLWIFFGFRIWGIGFVLGILYFGVPALFPFLSEETVGWFVGGLAIIWISRSLYKLFISDNPLIDEN